MLDDLHEFYCILPEKFLKIMNIGLTKELDHFIIFFSLNFSFDSSIL